MYSESILKKTMIYMTTFFISLVITIAALATIFFMSMWPYIFKTIKSKNESRSDHLLQMITGHFINQKIYIFLFLIHMNAAFCIGGIVMIATGTMLIGYLKYACGMFRIAR